MVGVPEPVQHPRGPGSDVARLRVAAVVEVYEKEGIVRGDGEADPIEMAPLIGGQCLVAAGPGAGIVGGRAAQTIGAQRRLAPTMVAVCPGPDHELRQRPHVVGDAGGFNRKGGWGASAGCVSDHSMPSTSR